jgi:hypothetical protein
MNPSLSHFLKAAVCISTSFIVILLSSSWQPSVFNYHHLSPQSSSYSPHHGNPLLHPSCIFPGSILSLLTTYSLYPSFIVSPTSPHVRDTGTLVFHQRSEPLANHLLGKLTWLCLWWDHSCSQLLEISANRLNLVTFCRAWEKNTFVCTEFARYPSRCKKKFAPRQDSNLCYSSLAYSRAHCRIYVTDIPRHILRVNPVIGRI